MRSTCCDLGLLMNTEKSTLTPVQCIEFIWDILDSKRARAFLPEECFWVMVDLICHLRNHLLTTAHTCLHLMGHMATCTYVSAMLNSICGLCRCAWTLSISPIGTPSTKWLW